MEGEAALGRVGSGRPEKIAALDAEPLQLVPPFRQAPDRLFAPHAGRITNSNRRLHWRGSAEPRNGLPPDRVCKRPAPSAQVMHLLQAIHLRPNPLFPRLLLD